MRTNDYSFAAVLSGIIWFNVMPVTSQEIPLVYDVENSVPPFEVCLPSFEDLPVIETLPDPFAWSDGSGRSTRFEDWGRRRMEIGAEIQHYEIGNKPERPDSITGLELVKDQLPIDLNHLAITGCSFAGKMALYAGAFGISDRFGFSIVGNHGHCILPDIQRPEVEAFIDRFLLGDETVNTKIEIHPYPEVNHAKWIQW